MAEIKVAPQHSASYIDSNPKKLEASLALPFVCVSYIGNSTPAAESYEGTVSGTVENTTDIAHLTPSSHVSFIGCDTKIVESSVALPVVCVSYVPSSNNDIDLDFDTARNISNVVTVNHDTCRNVSTAQTLSADLMRDVTASAVLNLDSSRIVANHVTVDVDTERKINGAISTTADFDLSRNVTATQNFSIDIKRDVIIALTLTADTSREVLNAHITQALNVDTCRNVCQSVTVLCDTQRIITADGNWRYENYGTADLLSTSGTTVTNLTKNQAVYQTAFYQPNRAKCFDIPATSEIWIRCDINVVSNVSSSRIRIYNEDSNGKVCGWSTDGTGITYNYVYWINNTNYDGGYRIARNDEGDDKQPFLIHMKSGTSDGFLEFYFWSKSNGSYRSFTGNVNNGNAFDNVYIQMDGSNIYVSDLIISNVAVDINEHTKYPLAFRVDLLRNVVETFAQQFYVDTLRNVVRSNLLNLDTLRDLILSAGVDYDTLRNVISTVDQNLDAVRTLAHTLTLSPVYNFGDLPDTSDDRRAGLQSFEIQIGEQQLTDSVNFVTVNPVDILEQVKGQYLDYKFNMRVEKIVQRGILRTCNCCSDIDELLYKQLDYVIPEEKRWTEYVEPHLIIGDKPDVEIRRYAPASEHIKAIANAIGKTTVLQFADFISTVDIESGGTTYNDLIKAIFGWSSRVPQMMINCYLRDDKLYVVQRGYESNIVDLSNYQSDVVSVSKDIVRTYWGSQLWSKTYVEKLFTGYDYDLITEALPTEKVDDNGNKTTYQPSSSGKVLVTRTEETVNGQTIVKTFDYDSDDFLIQSTEQGDAYKIETTYTYKDLGNKRKVLQREETVTMEKNSNDVWEVTDKRTTSHDYLYEGGGQVYVSSAGFTDFDVDHTGNVVGNGSGDDRISPYQIHVFQNGEEKILKSIIRTPTYDATDHLTIYGVTLFDSSFPIHGDDKLIEITNAIKWLNRKTQEVINLNVYDFPHVIDFNDKIVFGGNTYYLKSNSALKNDDIVNKQTISAVRWY